MIVQDFCRVTVEVEHANDMQLKERLRGENVLESPQCVLVELALQSLILVILRVGAVLRKHQSKSLETRKMNQFPRQRVPRSLVVQSLTLEALGASWERKRHIVVDLMNPRPDAGVPVTAQAAALI